MAIRTINFEENIFDKNWKKQNFSQNQNCNLGEVSYDAGADAIKHDMSSLNLDGECPDPNTNYVSFGKYNVMYPSQENVLEWEEFVDNVFTETNSVIYHEHYFFCNAEEYTNLKRGYFLRIIDEKEIEIGKLENEQETVFKHFDMQIPPIRRFKIEYKFDNNDKEATLRLHVIDDDGEILKTEQVIDTNPSDLLEPDKASSGYLNLVNYNEINNISSNQFLNENDEEYYNYEIWNITVVEELLNIIQDLKRDGRFYEKNSNLAVDLKWSNLNSSVVNNLQEVVLKRKENTFPKDHTEGEEIKRLTNPNTNSEVIATDDTISKNKEYYYAVFSKFDDSWINKVRNYKNAMIVDTSDIPPIEIVNNFSASAISNIYAKIGWSNPVDDQLDQYRVVRRKDGFPEDHEDGEIIVDEKNPQPGNFVNKNDYSIQPGNFYYYAVFTKRSAGDVWNDEVIYSG